MNKKNIKEIFETKINKKEIYNSVITEKERKKGMNKNYKYILATICLIVVLSIIFIPKSKTILEQENKDSVYINEVEDNGPIMLDIYIHPVELTTSIDHNHFTYIDELQDYPFYQNITIGSEYLSHTIYAVYIKSDTIKDIYDKLYYYTISYKIGSSDNSTKEVTISFSKENIPLRDCKLTSEDGTHSIINGTDLIIHQYNSSNYISTFQYNDINFDIQAKNITEEAFVNLLKEIIK